jgi:hypothetical protein
MAKRTADAAVYYVKRLRRPDTAFVIVNFFPWPQGPELTRMTLDAADVADLLEARNGEELWRPDDGEGEVECFFEIHKSNVVLEINESGEGQSYHKDTQLILCESEDDAVSRARIHYDVEHNRDADEREAEHKQFIEKHGEGCDMDEVVCPRCKVSAEACEEAFADELRRDGSVLMTHSQYGTAFSIYKFDWDTLRIHLAK